MSILVKGKMPFGGEKQENVKNQVHFGICPFGNTPAPRMVRRDE
jgi:hypothetical protein